MWSGISWLKPRSTKRAGALALFIAAFVAQGCAGRSTSTEPSDDDADHPTSHAGRGGAGQGGKGGAAGRGGGAGRGAGSGGMAGTGGDVPYIDPGCPDAAAPDPLVECDVFDASRACPLGYACKPQIDHPYGSGCDQEVFNMRCMIPGGGEQGAACDNGMSDCAEGFICVVGAAHGPQCLKMCPLDGSTRCPSGYVCGATDAEGIGVCA